MLPKSRFSKPNGSKKSLRYFLFFFFLWRFCGKTSDFAFCDLKTRRFLAIAMLRDARKRTKETKSNSETIGLWKNNEKLLSRCPSTVSRTVWKRKRVNFQGISLVSPTERERKHTFVRVQIEYGFGCFQVWFGPVVSTVWSGSEYGFAILLDESASKSHSQNGTRTAPW